ncbi:ATPase components of ABC transporters with duplicated ATPase domains [Enhydrobacter aerosaccus]|uniref:ATPase components of ABC transporters with duplicated ATPase domains n=1 Tax=Enhydrobacter aerosaccus TaxID=225324 RepID=A0A1T4TDG9_9HYPH|nr:ABC-F family ATP-binding cassette domain-containing protein [Enhydrobacter aerosaccus]SKA38544.1 ATPase components of ABC transporters with duplicated ATPase domains [Enhydrobacter aerosaccus]
MTFITLRSLGVTRSAVLFSNLTLSVNAEDRIGLVAANGAGKSTLLHCLAGTAEATAGEITRARGLTVGHVEQEVPSDLLDLSFHDAVLRALSPDRAESESWRVDLVLEELEVPEELRPRPLKALSGGWQRMAMLARVWVTEPDMLLLDEPTNHLDLGRIAALEQWLKALPRTVPLIVASHDRAFLDGVTNRTLFLRPDQSQIFDLPYSRARRALDEADAAQARRYERDMKTAGQLRRQAAKLNNIGINSGSDLLVVKTKQLKERAERLESAAKPAHRERSSGVLKLANRGTHAKALITLDDVEVRTPDGRALYRTGKLFLHQGDRVVLLGANGAGKSRLIAHVHEAIEADDRGDNGIRVTPSLVLGYADQTLGTLREAETPLDTLGRRFDIAEQKARGLLAAAGIGIDLQERPLGRLSGGQRARLVMLVLRLTNPNFYLLDEPTNHLDIEGQEALERELLAHQASCLLVSHDRSFVRAVGNRFWVIDRKRLLEVESPEPFFAAAAAVG